jgi:hypothetical protein
MFQENIDDVPFEDEAWRERLKGEVHFPDCLLLS